MSQSIFIKPTAPQPHPDSGYGDFRLIFILFLTFRLLSLFLLRPGGYIRDYSDFNWYLGIAALSDYGLYPFLDFWLEWPPPIPWLMVGAYRLALLLPAWEDHRFWFISILGTVFVLFEAGNFSLIRRIANRVTDGPRQVNHVLWLYAALFPPIYTMLGFFDGVALFFMLLACHWLIARRHHSAAVALAVGFAVKVIPIILLPVSLKLIWGQLGNQYRQLSLAWLKVVAVFLAMVLLLFSPFIIWGWPWLLTFFRAVLGRSSWETIWAVWEGFYGFGAVAGDRLNPNEMIFAIHPEMLPWNLITIGFGLIFLTIFVIKADLQQPRRIIAMAGLIVSVFMLYSKGFSPQFVVYLLPFVILLMPGLGGLSYALILTGLNILEQPLYFIIFDPNRGGSESWLLTAIVTARFILLIILSVEFGLILWQREYPVWQKNLRRVVAGVAVAGILLLIPFGLTAYQRVQLARSPHQPLITFLRAQIDQTDTLILTDQALYQHLYPFLRGDMEIKLAGGDAIFAGAPAVADLLLTEPAVWLLASGSRGGDVRNQLESLGQFTANFTFAESGDLIFVDLSQANLRPDYLAQSDQALTLLTYAAVVEADAIDLTLYWQATQPQDMDYTVFTQLLNSAGQLVTSHDSPPVNGTRPTSQWGPNEVVVDHHRLALPETVEPGAYRLVVGMYDADGIRQPFFDSKQTPFENNAVDLMEIPLSYREIK